MTMYTPLIIKFVKVAKLWQLYICGENFHDFERLRSKKYVLQKKKDTCMTRQCSNWVVPKLQKKR